MLNRTTAASTAFRGLIHGQRNGRGGRRRTAGARDGDDGSPTVAELVAVNVTTLEPVVGFVPNFAATPLGNPEAASETLPVKPFTSLTVIVSVVFPLCVTDAELADGVRLKLPKPPPLPEVALTLKLLIASLDRRSRSQSRTRRRSATTWIASCRAKLHRKRTAAGSDC